MKKSDAIKMFGKQKDLAKAVGRGPSAVSQWPEELGSAKTDMVIGAALRLGIKIPKCFLSNSKKITEKSAEF